VLGTVQGSEPMPVKPNAKTQAAMREARRGGLPRSKNVPSLLAELRSPECQHSWRPFTKWKAECSKCKKRIPWQDLFVMVGYKARAEAEDAKSLLGQVLMGEDVLTNRRWMRAVKRLMGEP
jgi:hypothetical protein